MDQAEFDKYVSGRYQDQVDWYDRKAQTNKKRYTILQYGLIFLAALTPLLVALGGRPNPWGWAAIIVSVLVAVGTASLRTFEYKKLWMNYRTTSETLRKEIQFYRARIGEYESNTDPQLHLVRRVESLISQENTMWLKPPSESDDEHGD